MSARSLVVCVLGCLVLAGCGRAPQASFRINLQGKDPDMFRVTGVKGEDVETKQKNAQNLKNLATILTAAFGTPDEPYVFPETGLDVKKLAVAAGPVSSDASGREHGLFRRHCVHCHGISGDGDGPTALFLVPYPRDYRQGKFKFKSTELAAKPTHDDLKKVIVGGVQGTAMPSFGLLPDDQVEALVEYVKYLSIRGETEQLVAYKFFDESDEVALEKGPILEEFIMPVVETWNGAEGQIVNVPKRPTGDSPGQLAASIAKGNELFHSAKAQCIQCHGPTGMGDGREEPLYDDWNKDKKQPVILKQLAELKAKPKTDETQRQLKQLDHQLAVERIAWDLPVQDLQPRNLRSGVYRGGRRPVDLYRRIHAGILGSQMPGAGASPGKQETLKSEEIWALVDYVRTLPYEPANDPSAVPSVEQINAK